MTEVGKWEAESAQIWELFLKLKLARARVVSAAVFGNGFNSWSKRSKPRRTAPPWCQGLAENSSDLATSSNLPTHSSEGIQRVLTTLSADRIAISSLPGQLDLSHVFPVPQTQGNTKACVAFALTSNLSTLLEGNPSLSAGLAHGFFTAQEQLRRIRDPLYSVVAQQFLPHQTESPQRRATTHARIEEEGVRSIEGALNILRDNPVSREQDFPFNPQGFLPESINRIQNRNFAVGQWIGSSGRANADDLRRLLQSGHPPAFLPRS